MSRLGIALLLVLASVVAGVGHASASDVTTIDDEHPLATSDAISTFETERNVSARVSQLDMSISVAEDHDDVGVRGFHTDANNVWVRVDYDEEIARTIRFYLPREMVSPRVKNDLSAVDSSVTADLSPAMDGNMTAVTLRVDGPTDVVFAVSKEAGVIWGAREGVKRAVNETTGITLPTFGNSDEWSYVDSARLNSTRAVALDVAADNVTLQWDADPGTERRWQSVPECSDVSDQTVCYYENDAKTMIMTPTDEAPTVRFKAGRDPVADLKSAINDLAQLDDRIADWVGSIFGGD